MSNSVSRDIVRQSTPLQKDRNYSTALHYANLIQHRKDIEASNLAALERLLDFPSSSTKSASEPSPEDVEEATQLLRLFQTSDFDTLVEERNINRRCGYVLCPNQNELQDTSAKFRILHGSKSKNDGLRIVQTRDLEKWCSNNCSRRAQQVRAQLSGEPAWTRDSAGPLDIILPRGSSTASQDSVSASQARVQEAVHEDPSIHDQNRELALERGERGPTGSPKTYVEIEERRPKDVADMTEQFNHLHAHDSVEGYQPRDLPQQIGMAALTGRTGDLLETL